MPEQKRDLLVGVTRDQDGNLDSIKSLNLSPNESHKRQTEATELPLPNDWTYLIHGSNLDRPQWAGDNACLLKDDILVLKGPGLSTISREDKLRSLQQKSNLQNRGITASGYNTTAAYGSGSANVLEIRVLFPQYHTRSALFFNAKQKLIERYGEQETNKIMEFCDTVWWKNHQAGRHPQLTGKSRLKKLRDEILDSGKRVIQYVPEQMFELYSNELNTSN